MRHSVLIPRIILIGLFLVVFSCFLFIVLNLPSVGSQSAWKDFGGRRSGLVKNGHSADTTRLNVIKEETDGIAHRDGKIGVSVLRSNTSTATDLHNHDMLESTHMGVPQIGIREKIWEMEDQLITAKAYLNFAPPNSNSHLFKELKLRIKEIERVLSQPKRVSSLSRSALQRMRTMEATLSKAERAYPDCPSMVSKLRAMTHNTEEQLRAQQKQATYLTQVATSSLPKGLHCLSMRLTTDFFTLNPEERELQNQNDYSDLYHYAVFSDNVLACAVVVNSTISTSNEPDKIVFHVVTDSLNFPAMKMWFLQNPPTPAKIEIKSLDDLKFFPSDFVSLFKLTGVRDIRYTSPLNYLRFYLPQVFPNLSKVLMLDHDVVVMRDLSELWRIDMREKVNLAVEMCDSADLSYRLNALVNFTDSVVSSNFDGDSCVWAYGMNMFDLNQWRKHDLMAKYQTLLQVGKRRQAWRTGSLPLGQMIFYNYTIALDMRWHLLGLGQPLSTVNSENIERAAVIHFDGALKPWLEISNQKYKVYWSKFLNYDNPYLQQCNIHQ